MSKHLFDQQVADADQMHELGIRIAKQLRDGDLVVLVGPLGAGKTTLTRGIGEGLRAIGNVSSPTFVIARTHRREDSEVPMVHVDAYRLGSAAELDDLDIDFENSIVLVEWGKGLLDGISDDWLEIEITRDHTGESELRELKLTGFGQRWSTVVF
jgi:tRNA threonylcarbamoyl adenosine modification protein YjeE